MKLLKQLLEVQGRTIGFYDNEANLDNVANRAVLMINSAVKALDDRNEDLTKENIMSWIESRYMDLTPRVRQAVEDSLDQDMDTTPVEYEQEEKDVSYNEPCEYGHSHCSTRNEGPCSEEIGHTFEAAHTPKDDKKLNKRLRDALKMVKKWKGPKKVVKESEYASIKRKRKSFEERQKSKLNKPIKKTETEDQRKARVNKNEKARARHWQKTGVSSSTVRWMKDNGML